MSKNGRSDLRGGGDMRSQGKNGMEAERRTVLGKGDQKEDKRQENNQGRNELELSIIISV